MSDDRVIKQLEGIIQSQASEIGSLKEEVKNLKDQMKYLLEVKRDVSG